MSAYGSNTGSSDQIPNGNAQQQQYLHSGAQQRPPIAPSPSGYQQAPNPQNYGTPSLDGNRHIGSPYGIQSQPSPMQPPHHQDSFYPNESQAMGGPNAVGGVTSQMGEMGLGGDSAAPSRPGRRKNRHAYHNLERSIVTEQAFDQSVGGAPPYLNPDTPHQTTSGAHPYAGQPVTPAMSQFPAQNNTVPFASGVPVGPFQTQNLGQNPQIPASSGTGVSAQGRVDPEQIPSIPRQRDAAAAYYLDHIYPTMEQHLPPPGAIPFVAQDQGNSSPKFARLTLNNIPSSSDALTQTGLPLGLVLQPLAPLQAGELPIPVLDFGDVGPPRCRRCRAYINPFMIFRSGGNKLVCNMCTFPNDVTPEYFAPTDPTGIRVDRAQRPELTTGTVEYLVPKEYWAKQPVGLRWLFVMDVSSDAVDKGFLKAFCRGVIGALYGDNDPDSEDKSLTEDSEPAHRSLPPGSKVGFVTFDKAMHYYNCSVNPCLPGFWRFDTNKA